MKKFKVQSTHLLMLIFGFAFFLFGCKRMTEIDTRDFDKQAKFEKFFQNSQTNDVAIQKVIQKLTKIRAENPDLLEKLINKVGYPRWDKTFSKNGKQNNARVNNGSNDTIVIIPFTLNTNLVTAYIEALINDTIQLGLQQRANYKNYPYGRLSPEIKNAEKFAYEFMLLEKRVFGHKRFKVVDTLLFKTAFSNINLNKNQFVFINLNKSNNISGRTTGDTVDDDVDVSLNPCVEIWFDPDGDEDPCDCSGNEYFHHYEGDCGGGAYFVGFGNGFGDYHGGVNIGTGDGNNDDGGFVIDDNMLRASIAEISSKVGGLNKNQFNWLYANHEAATEIFNQLNDDNSLEAITTAKIIIDAGSNNLLDQEWGEELGNSALPHLQQLYNCCPILMMPNFSLNWGQGILTEYAILRFENPTWSKWKCLWEANKERVHTYLDVAGLIPVIGEVFDIGSGILYTIEGDRFNATLSFAASVPFVGMYATATKYFKKTVTAIDGSKRTLKWIKLTNGFISFGDRGLLRKVLGLAKGDARVAHHIIPWAKREHPAIQKAAQSSRAFHMNEALNGIPLQPSVHSGSHFNYDSKILSYLDAIPANATPDFCYNKVMEIISKVRTATQNNPNVPINQLNF